jgi:26S proteasome regulatory subunit N9
LTDIVNDPNGIKGQALIDLYNNFIVDFEHRMNQLSLVRICLVVAAQFPCM